MSTHMHKHLARLLSHDHTLRYARVATAKPEELGGLQSVSKVWSKGSRSRLTCPFALFDRKSGSFSLTASAHCRLLSNKFWSSGN